MWGGAFFGVEPVNDVIDVDFASLMHVEELQQSTQRSKITNAVETSETKKMPQREPPCGVCALSLTDTGPHTVYAQRFGSNGVC